MKYIKSISFLFLLLTMNLFSQPRTIELNKDWKFHQVGKQDFYPAEVPGCVHTDLLKNSLIEDPFYRTNEKDLQWIDKVDWEYETTFNADNISYQNNIILEFKGLDTYTDIFLNDEKLLSTDNMFREWEIDIKNKLKPGENKLRILFHSPINRDIPKLENLGYQLPAINDQSEVGGLENQKVSIFARKAPYHYGWDWGPRFVTSGIWRPVLLKAWNNAVIEDIHFVQNSLSDKLAALTAVLEINSDLEDYFDLNIKTSDNELVTKKIKLKKGLNKINASFMIENPKLWWSNGAGEQNLYSFSTSISYKQKLIDEKINSFGLRTIEVIRNDDSSGQSFYFVVNGKPIFMKGANYIPSDIFLPRVSKDDYERIIKSAADANMNMLRVWGGGIYENDEFYDLCDKYGILLWQDFMFACSMYPGDEPFLENVKQEAIDNIKRLRNHPSIALWCGNNEMEDMWAYWGGVKDKFNEQQQKVIYDAYEEIFFNIISSVVREYDGTRFYWPSSPSSDYGIASKFESGDQHYWGVWHGKEPFEEFQNKVGRFVSEYGFQSFPEFKTVKSYTVPEDWDIESEVMMAHQRSGIGNLRIRDYLKMYYNTPKDFESFLYVGQVLQAYGIKQAIEAHRRAMPYCMGTLYWQIDDCWPVASWSGMDYYKRWKALHYNAKKAFEPVIISPVLKDDDVQFYIVSDKFEQLDANLIIKTIDFNGEESFNKSIKIKIEPNTSRSYFTISKSDLLGKADENKLLIQSVLKYNSEEVSCILYFKQPKDLNLEKPIISKEITKTDEGYLIKLRTDKLAKDVYLSIEEDGFFTDNYFDLLSGEEKAIMLKTNITVENLEGKLKIISLYDSY